MRLGGEVFGDMLVGLRNRLIREKEKKGVSRSLSWGVGRIFLIIFSSWGGRKVMGEGLFIRSLEGLVGSDGGWVLGRDRFFCYISSWDEDGSRGRGCF